MATVNLGNIKLNWKGAYNSSTAYIVDDVVSSNGSSYVCIQASTGNLPTVTTYWNQMSAAGTDGTDVGTTITTQGDILYRDGSGLQRLGAGTSGQFLKTQGTGANPVWATADSGKTLGVTQFTNGTRASMSAAGTSGVDFWSVNYTQLKANSKLLIYVGLHCYNGSAGATNYRIYYDGVAHTDIPIYNYYPSHAISYHGMKLIDGASSTGSKVLKINYYAQTGTHYPAQIFNPNSADDGRYVQQNSIMIVKELDF